jgi:hypothetical protein
MEAIRTEPIAKFERYYEMAEGRGCDTGTGPHDCGRHFTLQKPAIVICAQGDSPPVHISQKYLEEYDRD